MPESDDSFGRSGIANRHSYGPAIAVIIMIPVLGLIRIVKTDYNSAVVLISMMINYAVSVVVMT